MLRRRLLAVLLASALTSAPEARAQTRVVVEEDVIAADVGAFGTNIGAIGAGARLVRAGGGFEPTVLRLPIVAVADAPNRIEADLVALTLRRSLREGALDGAAVEVWRIEDGAFRHVRRGVVRDGGHHAGGWFDAIDSRRMLPPDRMSFEHVFPAWHRPDAPLWFTVRAVGPDGALSEPATAVMARSPAVPVEGRSRRRGDDDARGATIRRPRRQDGAAPAAPRDLRLEIGRTGRVLLRWSRGPGPRPAGWVAQWSETDPASHGGFHLDLEPTAGSAPIRAGDLAIVSRKFYSASRRIHHADRVWGVSRETQLLRPRAVDFWPDEDPDRSWHLALHDRDTPVEEAGETFLEVNLRGRATGTLSLTNHAGTDQDHYEVLPTEPLRVSVWLKADRPAQATLRFIGPYGDSIRPTIFEVGAGWRRHEATITPPRVLTGAKPGAMRLELQGPAVFGVDNLRIHPADTPHLILSDADAERLRTSGMGILRTHGFVKTGYGTYDLAQLTNPRGAIAGTAGGNTLPQTLGEIARIGADLWLQVEPHLSDDELRGLAEYLAAPFDPGRDDPVASPWAAKRVAQGRTAPWTDAFERIVIEFGNETWNRIMAPWVFRPLTDAATGREWSAGSVYGMAVERMIAALRSSPHWTEAIAGKTTFALGGWRRQPRFGLDAALAAPSAGMLAVAGYTGGWDEGEDALGRAPSSYAAVLSQPVQVAIPSAESLAVAAARVARDRGVPLTVGTYEAGPGYAHDGLNGANLSAEDIRAQEEVMKSQASAVATLDSFLARAAAGQMVQSWFVHGAGPRWSSHADWWRGGHAYAPWRALALFNRVGVGDMLRARVKDPPTLDLPETRRREAMDDAPMVAAYATRDGDRLAVVLISRRLPGWPRRGDDGVTPMTLALPITGAERLTLWRMAGPYNVHDVDSEQVRIEEVPLPVPELSGDLTLDETLGAAPGGLPPASALVYVFEGVRDHQ